MSTKNPIANVRGRSVSLLRTVGVYLLLVLVGIVRWEVCV